MYRKFRGGLMAIALASILASVLAPGAAVRAEEPGSEAERLLGEGAASLLQGLQLLLKTVPQYEAPEVLPNGDIIIRRVQPDDDVPEGKPPPPPEGDSTET